MTNVKTTRRTFLLAAVALATALAMPGLATAQVGNIDPAQHYAWMENAGWLDFRPAVEGVTVHPTYLSGYAWSENVGWIKLGVDTGGPYGNTTDADYGVNNSSGTLSGYAWSENAGWISFDPLYGGVTIGGTRLFVGYAWSENLGWIHLSNTPTYGVAFVCPAITVAPATLPAAVELQAYSQSVTASGGAGSYTYTTVDTLPAGLTLSAAGLVSGTATVHGTYTFSVIATDAQGCTGSQLVSLVIGCPTITVAPATLPAATELLAYSQSVTASGGTAPYTYATVDTLPTGLTLSAAGLVSGTPTVHGTFTFTVTATDAQGCTGSQLVSLTIACPTITVGPATLPAATELSAYSQSVTASGGTAPYTYATVDPLPTGLTLSAAGLVSGTATVHGTFTFTVIATDAQGCTGSQLVSLTIACPTITVGPATLPAATELSAYSQSVTASGGTAPYTYATVDTLPTGLTLSAAGLVSGTATVHGTFTFTVTATDAQGCTGSQLVSLTIACPTITVSPATLPAATELLAYSQSVTASGGTAPYTYAMVDTLPTGLTLSAAGLVSGTPTVNGTFTFTVTATDAQGCTGSQLVSLTIACPTITVSPATLPAATELSAYSQSVTASGGTAPYTYATVDPLPTGLTLSAAGLVSGTATVHGTFTFTVIATDAQGCTGSQLVSLTIACPTITVGPATLPAATELSAYSQSVTASGGTAPYTYATVDTLPTGLTLSAAGLVSGTATVHGTFTFTVTATDAQGCTGSQLVSLTIACPTITVAPATLLAGVEYQVYSQSVTASGGTAPYTYATADTLPTGLTLSAAGLVSGAATVHGTFTFTVTATDAQGCTGSQLVSLTIACPTITVGPATLPAATELSAYSQSVTASGGTAPYTYATADTLPTGLTLSGAGLVSGTPTVHGTFTFTVTATDAQGCTGSQLVSLTIACPTITVAPATLPGGVHGQAYSQTLSASGGTGPYSFNVTTGALPAGLTLSTAGLLSGTPTAPGTASFTVTATDSSACSGNLAYQLTVAARADLAITNVDSPDPAATGAQLTYTLTVSNLGPSDATSMTVTQTLPTGATFVSAAGTGWSCSQILGVVTCTLPTLASGVTAPSISVAVTTPITPGSLSSTATVAGAETDPNLANNTATAVTSVGALVPTALAVDAFSTGTTTSNHNEVFEPGESVVVAPSWQNTSASSLVLTSTAGTFIGAAGPVYTIGDGVAAYGTIAAGASGGCATGGNCFELGVTGSRPSTHWDTTFVETLDTGQTKTWTLHIGASFSDMPVSVTPGSFYHFVETLFHSGTTAGCTATTYCPTNQVSRAQMAMFIARASNDGVDAAVPVSGTVPSKGPYNCIAAGTSLFTDVAPTASYCRHVHFIASQGVTLGCTTTTYCPAGTVSRSQMAMFIARAIAGGDASVPLSYTDSGSGRTYDCAPATANTYFADVPATVSYCKHVHYLWARTVIAGCLASPPSYCPANLVRRDQMAKFLVNGFGFTLYEP